MMKIQGSVEPDIFLEGATKGDPLLITATTMIRSFLMTGMIAWS